jgi:orotate phosphoribosyltransferase-like protein
MLALITSPHALILNGQPRPYIVDALIKTSLQGNSVTIVSNKDKPDWFDKIFDKSRVTFRRTEARQNGVIIGQIAKELSIQTYDVLVLAVTDIDMQMAKTGKAVLIAAAWSNDVKVKNLGIQVASAIELQELIEMTNGWSGHWWFEGVESTYSARALMDLSEYGKDSDQILFAGKLKNTVKKGGARLTALLIVTARSLLIDGARNTDKLFWAVYPSSQSDNDDTEVLSEFTHRLRTTASQVQFSRKGKPLFIRHAASEKRSAKKGGDRTDPTGQITTLHLNPEYKTQIKGRNVIVIDDCTTYGVSFAVASAFLLKAGAASVNGVALGKFGNTMSYFDITINSDPFSPVQADGFQLKEVRPFNGNRDSTAQKILLTLIP